MALFPLFDKNVYNKCKKCGRKIHWGDFAYQQEICWNCFVEIVSKLIGKLRLETEYFEKSDFDKREVEIIIYMLMVVAEVFHKDEGGYILHDLNKKKHEPTR